jgi:preprotein translocase subunit YajC
MTTATTTTAEIGAPVAETPDQLTAGKMLSDNVMMLAMLFAIFYFVLIRPQQKRIKAHKTMVDSLAKGNRVITQGGLIGTIIKIDEKDVVVIEIAQGVRVKIAKSAITEITSEAAGASDSANDN